MKQDDTFYFDEINFRSVLLDLLRNLWVIVLTVLSVYICISAYEKTVYVPKYTSTATFMVSAKGSNNAYASLSITQEMAQVFSKVFQSNVLLKKVEEQSGESLDGYITANIINETNLIQVSLTSTSPEKAFKSLKIVLENYSAVSDLVFGNAVLEVIKAPAVPVAPSNTFNTSRYRKIGMLAAALLMTAAIVLLSVMRDTIKTQKAAKRKLDGRFLRSIRHEEKNKTIKAKLKRKNAAPLISNPLIGNSFKEDNLNLCSAIEYRMRKHNQKVIMFCSAGENEGKSTVAANFALALAAGNNKVLLLDCDFRKPALHKIFELDVDRTHSLGYNINHKEENPDVLLYLAKQGIYIGANSSGYKDAHRIASSEKLSEFVDRMREDMDYIIIDSPPMLIASEVKKMAQFVDTSVIVVREDCVYVKDINDSIDALKRTAPDMLGIVLNDAH